MTTSKTRLEERLESSDLLNNRLKIVLADIELAISYAERTGHTSLIGEAARLRKGARELKRRAHGVTDSLRHRLDGMKE